MNAVAVKMKVQANANPMIQKGLCGTSVKRIERYMLRTSTVCLPSFIKWNICAQFRAKHTRRIEHLYAFCKHIGNSVSLTLKPVMICKKQ